jgi:type III secretion apparatus needle protein
MSINFETVNNAMTSKLSSASSDLESAMKKVDMSKPEGLLQMQMSVSKWTMCTQLTSTLIKETGEALKGICQKV